MPLSPLAAHLICIVLFAADLVGRALRLRWYLRGFGAHITFAEAFRVNAYGDAAAGLTPLRFGGEIAKLGGLLRARVTARIALLGLGIEAAVTYPIVAAFGGWLAWRFAPAWWKSARPVLEGAVAAWWFWALAVGVVTLVAGGATWWWRRGRTRDREPAAPRPAIGELPAWTILTGAPLSLLNVVSRTLMLPVLAQSLPEHPPFGVMMVGSFVLLYSQLVLPTPGGAGAVDLGFLSGMAGDLGEGRAELLIVWRFYTVGAGALLGLGLAVGSIGLGPLVRAVARGAGRSRPA
jgi:uncharacterized membrane protein YbhN (UPF0104 family)